MTPATEITELAAFLIDHATKICATGSTSDTRLRQAATTLSSEHSARLAAEADIITVRKNMGACTDRWMARARAAEARGGELERALRQCKTQAGNSAFNLSQGAGDIDAAVRAFTSIEAVAARALPHPIEGEEKP